MRESKQDRAPRSRREQSREFLERGFCVNTELCIEYFGFVGNELGA